MYPRPIAVALAAFLAANAAVVLASPVDLRAAPTPDIARSLRQDLKGRRTPSFDALLRDWQSRYGVAAFSPLLEIARSAREEDADRYVALMAAAKLGGADTATLFVPLLKDRSWMVRNGALRALTALGNPVAGSAVLPLLRDPALVVRAEAVEAVVRLRPAGAVDALVAATRDPGNYHAEKAQWVPQRALAGLRALEAHEAAPRLLPLLDRRGDAELQTLTMDTLEALTGHIVAKNLPLQTRIDRWKTVLSPKALPTGALDAGTPSLN